MDSLIRKGIEEYCTRHSADEAEIYRRLAKETREKTESPQMQVGHLEGAFLRLLVKISRAESILEIGTFTGYSSLAMAEGLPDHGSVITCDIDPKNTQIARKFWSEHPSGRKITLKLGPAIDTLKSLTGPFDLVFIDADKVNYPNYWEACVPKVRSGGLIVADNVLWSGRVLSPEDEEDRAIVEFNRRVHSDSRVEAVMLTVRDGVFLARKK